MGIVDDGRRPLAHLADAGRFRLRFRLPRRLDEIDAELADDLDLPDLLVKRPQEPVGRATFHHPVEADAPGTSSSSKMRR